MTNVLTPGDVTAIVCTRNSIASIEACLVSLRSNNVGELIVVDAHSTDGTRNIATKYADIVIEDPGRGLGLARNIGIHESSRPLVLNMGSDNVMPVGTLEKIIDDLNSFEAQGVSAQTIILGTGFVANGLNAWRRGRFRPGPSRVIGTPTLFRGDLLRSDPFNPHAVYSDDSELCERWAAKYGSRFAISSAEVGELGKTTWAEVAIRCRMYGISDHEVYTRGRASGWAFSRRIRSILHPLRSDLLTPIAHLPVRDSLPNLPFLTAFTILRYVNWFKASRESSSSLSC